jgi:hypothetical protein
MTTAAPGTAVLHSQLQAVQFELAELRRQWEQERAALANRRRAMMLCWVDEEERAAGYGDGNGTPPRTSQIRQIWRELGQPVPTKGSE